MASSAPTAQAVLLHTVVPIIGAAVALAMYASPVTAVLRARRQRSLGVSCWCCPARTASPVSAVLNPADLLLGCLPRRCRTYNPCLLLRDEPPDAGCLAGLAVRVVLRRAAAGRADAVCPAGRRRAHRVGRALQCCDDCVLLRAREQRHHREWLPVVVGVCGMCAPSACADPTAPTAACLPACRRNRACTHAHHGTAQVVRTRDSSSILRPTCFASLLNGALWVCYGAAVGDLYVWLPNGIGAVVTLGLLALSYAWPPRGMQQAAAAKAGGAGSRDSSSLDCLISAQLSAPLQPSS